MSIRSFKKIIRRKRLKVIPICEYGCGRRAIHQLKNGKYCCSKSWLSCSEQKEKKSKQLKGRILPSAKQITNAKNKLCSYGCNQIAMYQLKNGKLCCSKSANSCSINRKKNSISVKISHTRPEVKEKHRIASLNPTTIKLRSEKGGLFWKDPIKRKAASEKLSRSKKEYYKDPLNRYKTMTSFKTGYFYSEKNKKEIYYRSSYELKAYKLLEQISAVLNYEIEPIMITRKIHGKWFKYVPDLIVNYTDGSKILLEIKPIKKLKEEDCIMKIKMGKEWAENNNMEYVVWTEKELII